MKTPFATVAAASSLLTGSTIAKPTTPYVPTWASTDQHTASPEWFRDAKFGVYWHWGVFTTPEYSSEWYGHDMYKPSSNVRKEHTKRYGPPETWGYENFILGANDLSGKHVQFDPVLSSAGGHFDPASWIDIVSASGARFAGPVAEHHDGFSMWDSKVNEWNSVGHTPHLDLARIWEGLVREKGMKFLVAMHTAFNTNGFYQYAPPHNDTSLQKLFGQLGKAKSDQLWLDKQKDILDHVQPDILWNDFALNSPGHCGPFPCAIGEQQRLEFLAYYFNRGVEWNKEVITTYKVLDPGFHDTSAVADFERGGPAGIVRPYWLTDDAISASSWSYTVGIRYYSSIQMIHSLLDRISKNGNMLLNISPTAAGILPDAQRKVLLDIGNYLARYGEAVYGTRAWDIYGEGPTQAGGGSFTVPLTGTSKDIRFTRSKAKDVLYATILGWPKDSTVTISSLGSNAQVDLSALQSIKLFGDSAGQFINITGFNQTKDGLIIKLPSQPAASVAYVLKLSFDCNIPVPQITGGVSAFTGDSVKGSGISLTKGQFPAIFFTDAGTNPADITLLRVDNGSTVTVYAKRNLTGTSTTLTTGLHTVAKGSVGSLDIKQT